MYCTNCGKKSEPGDLYCQGCGAQLAKPSGIESPAFISPLSQDTAVPSPAFPIFPENNEGYQEPGTMPHDQNGVVETAELSGSAAPSTLDTGMQLSEENNGNEINRYAYPFPAQADSAGKPSAHSEYESLKAVSEEQSTYRSAGMAAQAAEMKDKPAAAAAKPAANTSYPKQTNEKVFFGKGAFIFCLIIIFVLSVLCGIFAGLYASVSAADIDPSSYAASSSIEESAEAVLPYLG